MPVSVLIADHQFLTREGLYASLNKEEDLDVSTIENWTNIEKSSLDKQPDLLILDYAEKELSLETRKQLKALIEMYQNLLIISSDENKDTIKEVIDLGAKGFLTKNCTRDEIILAIKTISGGSHFFCNTVLEIIMEKPEKPANKPSELSSREYDVLELIAVGHSTAKIADQLHISVHTVNSHRKNILKKLSLKSPTQLVAYAHEMGLFKK
ncbi:MAG: response regulator transcription factor [Bacteroidota bacterium]